MDRKYFQEYYYLERNHWWFKNRSIILFNTISKNLDKESGTVSILNVGAATGASTTMLSNFGKVTSLEYDKISCQFAQEKLGLEFIHGSILSLPFEDHTFDLVCAFDVIEHIDDDQKGVEELFRVCKPNGNIFVTVPAYMFLWSQHDVVNHHYRRYTLSKVKTLMNQFGGEHVYTTYFNTLLFPLISIFRIVSELFSFRKEREGSGSDFSINTSSFLERVFDKIFALETKLLKNNLTFPFGVSALAFYKKSTVDHPS